MIPISTMSKRASSPPLQIPAPEVEYLLVCQAQTHSFCDGAWSFALETASGNSVLEAEDVETGDLNRLTLLAAVRGLESIDGPASVLLLSNNRYLIRSLSESLPRWRASGFEWEHFGRRMEVQHADLWRRIDRALEIHWVQACLISSRFVSGPQVKANQQTRDTQVLPKDNTAGRGAWEGTTAWDRVDHAHASSIGPRSSDRDGLRRWLLGDVAKQAGPVVKRRFESADLLE
jgi:ribonuclease HI